jgi:hypothetical protein
MPDCFIYDFADEWRIGKLFSIRQEKTSAKKTAGVKNKIIFERRRGYGITTNLTFIIYYSLLLVNNYFP